MVSKKGNFFGSIFFHIKKNYASIEEFSLINPILNIDVLSKYCGRKNTFFKSPNDIYINKKKICQLCSRHDSLFLTLTSYNDKRHYLSANIFQVKTQPPEPAIRMADIRDVTDGIGKLRKTYN